MKLSWPATIIICFFGLLIFGTLIHLIDTGKAAPQALYMALIGAVSLPVAWFSKRLGFQEGLVKMPPFLEGAEVETRIVKTTAPPPIEPLGPSPSVGSLLGVPSMSPPKVIDTVIVAPDDEPKEGT